LHEELAKNVQLLRQQANDNTQMVKSVSTDYSQKTREQDTELNRIKGDKNKLTEAVNIQQQEIITLKNEMKQMLIKTNQMSGN
jgi:hypothetical protein